MKNVIARSVARMIVVGCALAPVGLYAQDKGMTADVPFAFYMGDKAMPQGAYRVEEMKNGAIVRVHSAMASNILATVNITGNKQQEAPRLLFNCYGATCFLNQVWTGYSSHGIALPHSRREKEMASNGRTGTLAVIKLAVR